MTQRQIALLWLFILMIAGGTGICCFQFGRQHERELHSRLVIRGDAPGTELGWNDKAKSVTCIEAGMETDCTAWLTKHFAQTCAWEPEAK